MRPAWIPILVCLLPACQGLYRDENTDFDRVRRENLRLVQECARLAPSQSATASFDFTQACYRDVRQGTRAGYTVATTTGGATLTVALLLTAFDAQAARIARGSPRESAMLAAIHACIPKVQAVWARYGIDFDLQAGTESDGLPDSPARHAVELVDGGGRSDVERYYFGGDEGGMPSTDPDALCKLMLHETGHLLGFHDEYADPQCPDHVVSHDEYPVSPMSSEDGPWEGMDFQPRHIRAVLAPLCPDLE